MRTYFAADCLRRAPGAPPSFLEGGSWGSLPTPDPDFQLSTRRGTPRGCPTLVFGGWVLGSSSDSGPQTSNYPSKTDPSRVPLPRFWRVGLGVLFQLPTPDFQLSVEDGSLALRGKALGKILTREGVSYRGNPASKSHRLNTLRKNVFERGGRSFSSPRVSRGSDTNAWQSIGLQPLRNCFSTFSASCKTCPTRGATDCGAGASNRKPLSGIAHLAQSLEMCLRDTRILLK